MKRNLSTWLAAGALFTATLWSVGGCGQTGTVAQDAASSTASDQAPSSPTIPAATRIDVVLASSLSSETAQVGDRWHGTVTDGSGRRSDGLIPGGSRVAGEVVAVRPAERGSRAMLELDLTSIQIDGKDRPVNASADAVVAGSTRKRNVGAIAGGVLAGALIGKNVGDGKNAAAGGLIGGAAATGVVASSKGFQVLLAPGTLMSFTTGQPVALR
jgi:hypothetical protein